MMTGPPGAISCEVGTGLPRPRDQITTKELPEFVRLRTEVSRLVRSRAALPLESGVQAKTEP